MRRLGRAQAAALTATRIMAPGVQSLGNNVDHPEHHLRVPYTACVPECVTFAWIKELRRLGFQSLKGQLQFLWG